MLETIGYIFITLGLFPVALFILGNIVLLIIDLCRDLGRDWRVYSALALCVSFILIGMLLLRG